MRALVIATGYNPDFVFAPERYAGALIPLVDRPFIQHVVEFLVAAGVQEFDFVLSQSAQAYEELLGDGARWGVSFRFHLARDVRRPYRILRALGLESSSQTLLLAHGDRLPRIALEAVSAPCWYGTPETGEAQTWSGWALLDGAILAELDDQADEAALSELLARKKATGQMRAETVPVVLSAQTAGLLLESHWAVLNGAFPDLLLTGREVEPGIWLSRNISLHPTARIAPPAYVGENCRIEMGAQIGPGAVVGRDCMIDRRASVANSLVFKGSYVGEELELQDAVVDRNRLYNARVGVAVTVADNFILGSLEERDMKPVLQALLHRLAAVVLLVLFSPFLVGTAVLLKLFRAGPLLFRKEVVRLPAADDEHLWRTFSLFSFSPFEPVAAPARLCGPLRHFLLGFLPALMNIARGDLNFVGVQPRSPLEIRAMPEDWRGLYLPTRAGIVTEAHVIYGPSPTRDERYAAEAFYAVSHNLGHDVKLLMSYLRRLFRIR